MHELPINDDLVYSNSVVLRISWVRRRGDLYLAPLLVGRHKLALGCAVLEFPINALVFDAAFSLDKRRF